MTNFETDTYSEELFDFTEEEYDAVYCDDCEG